MKNNTKLENQNINSDRNQLLPKIKKKPTVNHYIKAWKAIVFGGFTKNEVLKILRNEGINISEQELNDQLELALSYGPSAFQTGYLNQIGRIANSLFFGVFGGYSGISAANFIYAWITKSPFDLPVPSWILTVGGVTGFVIIAYGGYQISGFVVRKFIVVWQPKEKKDRFIKHMWTIKSNEQITEKYEKLKKKNDLLTQQYQNLEKTQKHNTDLRTLIHKFNDHSVQYLYSIERHLDINDVSISENRYQVSSKIKKRNTVEKPEQLKEINENLVEHSIDINQQKPLSSLEKSQFGELYIKWADSDEIAKNGGPSVDEQKKYANALIELMRKTAYLNSPLYMFLFFVITILTAVNTGLGIGPKMAAYIYSETVSHQSNHSIDATPRDWIIGITILFILAAIIMKFTFEDAPIRRNIRQIGSLFSCKKSINQPSDIAESTHSSTQRLSEVDLNGRGNLLKNIVQFQSENKTLQDKINRLSIELNSSSATIYNESETPLGAIRENLGFLEKHIITAKSNNKNTLQQMPAKMYKFTNN